MRNIKDADAFYLDRRDLFTGHAPIKFVNVEGTEEREKDSPSWFNKDELNQVFNVVRKLIGRSTKHKIKVNYSDIGIVTP